MNNKIKIILKVYHETTFLYVFNGSLNTLFCTLPLTQNMDIFFCIFPSVLYFYLKSHVEGNISLKLMRRVGATLQVSLKMRIPASMFMALNYF